MTPFASLWLPIVLSAIAVFVVSSIIHMVMPWHKSDFEPVPNEDGFMDAMRTFNLAPGDYLTPAPRSMAYMKSAEYIDKRARGPVAIMTIMSNGHFAMGQLMATWFLFILVVAAITGWLTGSIVAPGAESRMPFHYSAIITFLCYSMGAVPASIWYSKKWSTTFKTLFDALLYGLATGAVFMFMWPKM